MQKSGAKTAPSTPKMSRKSDRSRKAKRPLPPHRKTPARSPGAAVRVPEPRTPLAAKGAALEMTSASSNSRESTSSPSFTGSGGPALTPGANNSWPTRGTAHQQYHSLEVSATMAAAAKASSGKGLTATKPGDQELIRETYFHGLLPREDADLMLRKEGDFLVRRSGLGKENTQTNIVSVLWGKRRYHFLIEMGDDGNVSLEGIASNSVVGLINAYRSRDFPLSAKTGALLLNPVPRQEWELYHEDVILKQKLGEGAFGEVFRGELTLDKGPKGTPIEVAVKKHYDIMVTKSDIELLMREARIMRQYKHVNIVLFYGVAVQQQPIYLVMELVTGGSLDKFLRKNKNTIDNKARLQFTLDAATGLRYLHSIKSIHRDVSARNCLVDIAHNNRIKISDFGLAKQANNYRMSGRGKVPVRWLAPETLKKLDYSKKTDVWSFGVLVWEIYSNCEEEPYASMTTKDIQGALQSGHRLTAPPLMEKTLKELCDRCWLADPKARPQFVLIVSYLQDIKKMVANPSLDKVNKDKVKKKRDETAENKIDPEIGGKKKKKLNKKSNAKSK